MTYVEDLETLTYNPSPEAVEAERRYWAQMDRIADYQSWVVAQAEAQLEEYYEFEMDGVQPW